MKHKIWLLSIVFFILMGCNAIKSFPAETHTPANLPNLAEILQISKIRSIEIKNDWGGLAYVYSIEQHARLSPAETTFTGDVNFKLSSERGKITTESHNLQIPTKDINLFIEKLAETTFVQGEYTPLIEWTDDYPEIDITIELQSDTISFITASQGKYHIPWGMRYQSKTYVIDSSTPMDAFDKLAVYLKNDQLNKLIEQVSEEYYDPKTTNEPTHIP